VENQRILAEIAVQILGFGIVFLVLKKLAWSKLLGAVDDRRHHIEAQFADLEKRKAGLESLEKEYRSKLEKIEQEARAKIQEAASQGQILARDIQEKARQDAKRLSERATADLEQEIAKARITMRNDVVEIATLVAEKVLREKLDAQSHGKLVERFIQDIEKVR
jgi:F-type H+-transporting ATPase subunit b